MSLSKNLNAMNDLKKVVTPLTRGIIWLPKDQELSRNPHYADLDYLLDGLLTANLKETDSTFSSKVIIGNNYGKLLYVYVVREIQPNETESFVTLVKKDLMAENDILIIDETDSSGKMKSQLSEISSHLKIIQ